MNPPNPLVGDQFPPPIAPWDGQWPPDPSWDELHNFPPAPQDMAPILQPQPFALPQTPPSLPPPAAPELPGMPPMAYGEPDWSGLTYQTPPSAQEIEMPADEILQSDAIDSVVNLPPDEYATLLAGNQYDHEQKINAQKAEQRALDNQRAIDSERMFIESREQTRRQLDDVSAERDRLLNEKVDPDGWMASRSTSQTIAAFIAAIAGGFVQARHGGENPGLAAINRAIDRHIAVQESNLARRRALLGDKQASIADQQARIYEDFKTREAFRQAAYQRAVDGIDAEASQLDPNGTRAMRLAGVKHDVLAKMAQAQELAANELLDRNIKIGEFEMKRAEFEAKQHARMMGGGIGVASSSATKQKFLPDELGQMFGWAPPANMGPMTVGEYKAVSEARQKGEGFSDTDKFDIEREKFEHALKINGPGRKPLMVYVTDDEGNRVIGPDGKPKKKIFLAKNDANAELISSKMNSALAIIDILDEVEDIRREYGGETALFNSEGRQRLEVLAPRLTMLAKSGTHGMSSDADMKNLSESVAANDLASFRDKSAKLAEARARTLSDLNSFLNDKGNYNGDPITVPNKYGAKPSPSADDSRMSELIKSSEMDSKRLDNKLRARFGGDENPKVAAEKQTIQGWAEAAASGDESAKRRLEELAKKATTKEVRDLANSAVYAIPFIRWGNSLGGK